MQWAYDHICLSADYEWYQRFTFGAVQTPPCCRLCGAPFVISEVWDDTIRWSNIADPDDWGV
jgi:hypothetical protein